MPDTPIRAVLTDLDGVIRDWSRQDAASIERRFGLPSGAITDAAFDPELLLPAITGAVSDEAWRGQIVKRLREGYPGADAEAAIAAWTAPAGEIDREALATIQQVRERVPVALVTNATDRLAIDLERLGVLDAFDHIVNSSVVGAAKPDRAIFAHALEMVGASAGETYYIDDTERYHGPASEMGLICHHYRSLDGLREELGRLGLLG